jgi:copper chaperone CopZ
MSTGKNNKILFGSGLLLALTSSLCCIAPILAIISGTGSAIVAFSWADPLRPYLLAVTALVLGVAFYQVYKPRQEDECGCEEKRSVLRSKSFLWVIVVLSILLSSFPYFAHLFQRQVLQEALINRSPTIRQVVLHIQGMGCQECERYVNRALLQQKGVQEANTSYAKGEATIKFDSTQISMQQLTSTIENETGYKVIR